MSTGSGDSDEKGIEESDSAETLHEKPSDTLSSTYQITPGHSFKTTKIKEIIDNVLTEILTGKKYTDAECVTWSKSIADTVSAKVKELEMQRYKHVVQVMIGHQLGAGCKFIARCRWDAESDNQTSQVFTNATIFCIVTVFGTFHY